MFKIGCHLSASGGYEHMGQSALSIGANTFQFFTRNPRGGSAKAIDEGDVERFLQLARANDFAPILAHAPYTLNPCSATEKTREFAHFVFADDLKRLEYTPGSMYNFHPGSHTGQGVETGITLIAQLLNTVMFKEQHTMVLLETMAGKGTEIGGEFAHLKAIIDRTEIGDKIGVCLDTCHVFDAGYDIVNNLDGVLQEFDEKIGLSYLKAIHLNDSKNALTSHKDRHAVIGGGNIGLDAVTKVINHPLLRDLPFYLETPNDIDGYAREIALLKSLRSEA